jgi:hypothetical protein
VIHLADLHELRGTLPELLARNALRLVLLFSAVPAGVFEWSVVEA